MVLYGYSVTFGHRSFLSLSETPRGQHYWPLVVVFVLSDPQTIPKGGKKQNLLTQALSLL